MTQRVHGGARLLGDLGPCLMNVGRLDHNALPMIIKMERTGLQTDLSHFAKMEKTLTDDMDHITEEVRDLTGHYINVGSPDQVAELLFKKIGIKQARPKLTSSGDRESVEEEVLLAIQHEHPVVNKILSYREYSKLRGTYVVPMPKLARRTAFGVWRMFPNFTTTRIPSGRYACIRKGTPIEITRDVLKFPKGVAIEEVQPGDYAYSYDDNLNLTLQRVKAVWCTGIKPLYRIYWIGTGRKHRGYLDLTGDHQVRLTTGEYKRADSLQYGDTVCALSRDSSNRYCRLWATGAGEISEHRFVHSKVYGGNPEHVHHKNHNKRDNHPSNLQGLSIADHEKSHQERVFSRKHRTGLGKQFKKGHNHTVISVQNLNELDYVYDMEIENTHNFIAGELCVHNCKDPNLLAMPTRTERGQDIRRGFITDPGWCYISVDFSQIECRIAAHLSQDPALMAVYFNEEDVYSDFAIAAFKLKDERFRDETGWHYPHVHKMDHRYPAKTCILASIYAVTPPGLLDQMPIVCSHCGKVVADHDCSRFSALWTEAKCNDLINAFYLKYPGVMHDRLKNHRIMRDQAYIYSMWGRLMHTAAVRSIHPHVVEGALREGANFPYQEGAGGVFKVSLAHIYDDLEAWNMFDVVHPLLPVHDEIVLEAREDVAQEVMEHIKHRFETDVRLTVPIKAGGDYGAKNWGSIAK